MDAELHDQLELLLLALALGGEVVLQQRVARVVVVDLPGLVDLSVDLEGR